MDVNEKVLLISRPLDLAQGEPNVIVFACETEKNRCSYSFFLFLFFFFIPKISNKMNMQRSKFKMNGMEKVC